MILFQTVDHYLAVLTRIIELRFSYALAPDTYAIV